MSIERYVPPELPDVAFTRGSPPEHPKSVPLPRSFSVGHQEGGSELPAAGARVVCANNALAEEYLEIGQSYTVEYENTFTHNYRLVGIPLKFFSKKRFTPDEGDAMRLVDTGA